MNLDNFYDFEMNLNERKETLDCEQKEKTTWMKLADFSS